MRKLLIAFFLAVTALTFAMGPVAAADGPCCYDVGSMQLR